LRHESQENEMKTLRKNLGSRLFTIALAWSKSMPETVKARKEKIKAVKGRKKIFDGSKSIEAALKAVEKVTEEIKLARTERNYRKLSANLGYCPVYAESYFGRKRPGTHGKPEKAKTPAYFSKSINYRLKSFKTKNFKRNLDYRFDQSPDIILTNDPGSVGIYQSDYLDWDYYSKSTKYPKKIVNTSIHIPESWGVRVAKAGLAVVGGMTTLDAQRLEGAPTGVTVYAATWMVQGRGYAIDTVRGFIAITGNHNFHATSFDKAVKGVMRKANLSGEVFANLLTKHGIESLSTRCPELTVCVSDAVKIGACDYGIRSWCSAVSIDYNTGCAPLKTVYDAYLSRPMPEARAAILHALKRNKRTILQAA
jgi:hypothetical protein